MPNGGVGLTEAPSLAEQFDQWYARQSEPDHDK
jgi:hypothetical protein